MGDSEAEPDVAAPAAGESRRRKPSQLRWVVSAGVVVIVVAATVVALTLSGATKPRAAGGGTTATTSAGPKVSPIDAKLWVRAELAGIGDGDPHPYDLWAVGPMPLGRSLVLMQADGSRDISIPVYVIELRGNFVCGGCSGPPGAKAPAGHVISIWVLASNLSTEGFALGNDWINLRGVAKAFHLVAPPGGLTPLDRHPNLVPFVHVWGNPGGRLVVTIKSGTLRYGGTQCRTAAGGSGCEAITFRVSGIGGGTQVPHHFLIGSIETDTAELTPGSHIELGLDPNGDIVVTVTGTPTVPIPNPWVRQ